MNTPPLVACRRLAGDRPARILLKTSAGMYLAVLLLCHPAAAGTISPDLRARLDTLDDGAQTTAIIALEEQADLASLHRALRVSRAGRAERHLRVVQALQAAAAGSQPAFLAAVDALAARSEISGRTPYWISNLVVVRGTRQAIETLAARPDVAMAEANFRARPVRPPESAVVRTPRGGGGPTPPDSAGNPPGLEQSAEGARGRVTPGLRAIRADRVWHELGVNGNGVIVATMDTGVDGGHPALRDRWRGATGHAASESWLDVQGTTQFPHDPHGHGTHVTGTVTGLGTSTGDTIGVAWGAEWIACNPLGQYSGIEFDNDIIRCFQWLADPDGDPATVDDVPVVVQNSWKIDPDYPSVPPYTPCDSRWWNVIDACEAAGCVVIFSAGNDGPSPQSLGSPSDRASTPYNVCSIGAVDATHSNWPYPIASWSSRGPSACDAPPAWRIKPEIVAPGVDVYSSVPGGGYEQTDWSGTSMAGPHVAGVVGLMLAAAPDMDAETAKAILLETARDEGPAGDDNAYGHGFVDAYAAVARCLSGWGTVEGTVANGTDGGAPVSGATVRLLEIDRRIMTSHQGEYAGLAPPGSYTLEATHPSCRTEFVTGVVVREGQSSRADFVLTDIAPPEIAAPAFPDWAAEERAIPLSVLINDLSSLTRSVILWRAEGGTWQEAPMSLVRTVGGAPENYEGAIPGQPVGTRVEFYVLAEDAAGHQATEPAGAPDEAHEIDILRLCFEDAAEVDLGWSLSSGGDAVAGRWVRIDPLGTTWEGWLAEPADDHSPDGIRCFVTGAGIQGGSPWLSDVDGGCVTLTSPRIDLSMVTGAVFTYWRWFTRLGTELSGTFQALASSNDGSSWVSLQTLSQNANRWTRVTHPLEGSIDFTNQVRLRFVACDPAGDTLVEAAIDDLACGGLPAGTSGFPARTPAKNLSEPVRLAARPIPAGREVQLRFGLAAATAVDLAIYQADGRLVRSLWNGALPPGDHTFVWDGRDAASRFVGSGVFWGRLTTPAGTATVRILSVR